jgi:hypothetical protein
MRNKLGNSACDIPACGELSHRRTFQQDYLPGGDLGSRETGMHSPLLRIEESSRLSSVIDVVASR